MLRHCQKLKKLHLGNNPISDAGLVHLDNCPMLEDLDLSLDKGLTDASIPELSKLKHLKKMDLQYTSLSRLGAEILRFKLPHTQIEWCPESPEDSFASNY